MSALPGAVRWRLLESPPADGATNMAIDHSLARHAAASGEAIVRVYAWAPATISFGRNQRAAGRYDAEAIRQAGLGVVRRPTGGRSILHDRELTYAVAMPAAPGTDLRGTYDAVTGLLLAALASLGVAAERAMPAGRARAPGPMPCFAEPAAGEVSWQGRKLAGSAQWQEGAALLQHGSVLVDDDQARLAAFTAGDATPAVATLREALGRAPSLAEFAAAWADAVHAVVGARPARLAPDDPDAQPHPPLLRLYLDGAWTWRR
ncbi:MAG: hypothetical protein HY275_10480 [Gemmatimonadetes bacterium]|nr:hypothetical protein [Gemmatimonadota bacterium]